MRAVMIFFFLLIGLLMTVENAFAQSDWSFAATDRAGSRLLVSKSAPLVVAVIDTGADLLHPALKGAAWRNPGETGLDSQGRDKASNGIDDDGNGFIDDVSGWNFAGNDGFIHDSHGHGTHISGIINAVAPGVKLMTLKYYDPKSKGEDNLKALIQAIRYAVKMKADVINYSGGGFVPNLEERAAIREAEKKGILFVAAAGNEATNSDKRHFYPAGYDLNNILSVTAHDPRMDILPSSNYGTQTVHLAAPGAAVLSALPQGAWGAMTGTSQATAFVTGAACLLKTQRPDLSASELKAQLEDSARFETQMRGKVASAGRLDLRRTLALQDAGRSLSGYRLETYTVLRNKALMRSRLGSETSLK
ncbi:MAG: S8 family serine peptidase [Bdellovibrionaceae bacterium]|nr:S8 family serine peptidase [Pseudobdellovibrionaceae bacterium]